MTFFEFIDVHFQNKSFQNSQKFSLKTDGELQALHKLVNLNRSFFRWIALLKFPFIFWLTKLLILEKPKKNVPEPKLNIKESKAPHLGVVENPKP